MGDGQECRGGEMKRGALVRYHERTIIRLMHLQKSHDMRILLICGCELKRVAYHMHFARRGMTVDSILTGSMEVELQKLIVLAFVIHNGGCIWSDLHCVTIEQDTALLISSEFA